MQFFHCFLALHYVPLITAGGPWKLETYSCPIRRSLPLTSTNKITDTTSKKKRKTTTTLESQDNTFTSPCGENIYKKKWQLEINARKVRSHHTVTVWKHFVVHTLFLTQKGCFFFFFDTFLFPLRNGHFVQSSSLFKILCKHSMHIHTVNIFIYIYVLYLYIYRYIYIYLYRTWLSASYGSTVTHTHFVLKTKLDTRQLHCF